MDLMDSIWKIKLISYPFITKAYLNILYNQSKRFSITDLIKISEVPKVFWLGSAIFTIYRKFNLHILIYSVFLWALSTAKSNPLLRFNKLKPTGSKRDFAWGFPSWIQLLYLHKPLPFLYGCLNCFMLVWHINHLCGWRQ